VQWVKGEGEKGLVQMEDVYGVHEAFRREKKKRSRIVGTKKGRNTKIEDHIRTIVALATVQKEGKTQGNHDRDERPKTKRARRRGISSPPKAKRVVEGEEEPAGSRGKQKLLGGLPQSRKSKREKKKKHTKITAEEKWHQSNWNEKKGESSKTPTRRRRGQSASEKCPPLLNSIRKAVGKMITPSRKKRTSSKTPTEYPQQQQIKI